jgi:hypothetical protein
MALKLGELFGALELDSSEWDKKLAAAHENLQGFGAKGAVVAGAAGVVIGAAIGKGIAGALDMEVSNDKLKASLGLTEQQSAAAGRAAGDLFAANYGESIGEVSGAVEAVMSSISGMRDASDADIQAMTEKMLILSHAMGIDVVRASQVAGQMISTGLAGDGAEAADLLMASLQQVPVAVREDVLDATDEYSVFFEQLGIGGEQAMGMLVAASEKGMYGIDKTGDALKEFTLLAGDLGNKGAQDAFTELGLSGEEMAGKIVQGGETANEAFGQIVTGLQGIKDPAEQYQTSLALFGTPLEDLSAKDIPAFLASLSSAESGLGEVSGAVEKAGDDLYGNAQAGFGHFKRQAEIALIDVVNAGIMPALSRFAGFLSGTVGPALIQVGDWITGTALPALRGFGQWFADNRGAIITWAGIIGALLIPVFIRLAVQAALSAAAQVTAWATASGGAIKAAAVYVATSYTMIGRWAAMSAAAIASGARTAAVWTASIIASAVSGAAAFAVQAARVVGGWVLMSAQSLIHAARMAGAWLIAMGPVGWVIAAVVGLVALIIANWDTISKWTAKAWSAVTKWVSGAWKNIVGGVSKGISAAVNFIVNGWNQAKAVTTGVWKTVLAFFSGVWNTIKSGISAFIQGAISLFLRFHPLGLIISKWSAITGFFSRVWSTVTSGISGFVSDATGFFRELPGRILGALGNLGGLLLNAGNQIMGGFLQGLKDSWGAVTDFVGGIGQWIADNKGPKRYDQQLLVPAGNWIMGGLNKGLKAQIPELKRTLGDVASVITGLDPGLAISGAGRLGIPDTARSIQPIPGSILNRNQVNVYVQNPFTGEYLLTKVEEVAVSASGQRLSDELMRVSRGGKYVGP